MTNAIVAHTPPLPTTYQQTERLQETASYRAASQLIRYTDPDGRSFTLSLGAETATYSLTYDRTAQVRGGHPYGEVRRHAIREEIKELREEIDDVTEALRKAGIEVKGFKKLLHRMLKAVDAGYRERFRQSDPVEEEVAGFEQVHLDVAAVAQRVTVAMDDVDPEYWSVENTARRLVDFGGSLYRGGDRAEHYRQMVAAMEQGYAEAAEAFGGTLPEIAGQTIERATELLAEWAAQGAEAPAPLQMVA